MVVIIVGINRGGTSAITASLHSLCIPLGDKAKPPIFEDDVLAELFRRKDWSQFKRVAEKYDKQHGLWAWKLPDSINMLNRVDKLFSDKKYIFVFRDLVAVANRKEDTLGQDKSITMARDIKRYSKAIKHYVKHPDSSMLVSYEKLLTDTESYAVQLLTFLGMDITDENKQAIASSISISPAEYSDWADNSRHVRELAMQKMQGHLDIVDGKQAAGWVLNSDNDHPLEVSLQIEGKVAQTTIADDYRKDLIEAGLSVHGRHGFKFDLPADVGKNTRISVIDSASGVVVPPVHIV